MNYIRAGLRQLLRKNVRLFAGRSFFVSGLFLEEKAGYPVFFVIDGALFTLALQRGDKPLGSFNRLSAGSQS